MSGGLRGFGGRVLGKVFGVGKKKAKETVEEVVDEVIDEAKQKARDVFGTYVVERRTTTGVAVRRYDDGSVRIGKQLMSPPTKP